MLAKTNIPERGVYAITAIDGRAYVGGSVNIISRWRTHLSSLRLGKHDNHLLQEAWLQMGERAFTFEVLEIVSACSAIYPAEQRHMDRLRAYGFGFNIYPTAGSPLGSTHTDETRAKMSRSLTGLCAGEKNGRSKIGASDVIAIRRLSGDGLGQAEIAAMFNVSRRNISLIVSRARWGHITD